MRPLFLILLFLGCRLASAQAINEIDTIADDKLAIQKIFTALSKKNNDPLLLCQLAEKKLVIGETDSCIFYSNKSIEHLAKSNNQQLLARAYHTKGNAQYFIDDKKNAEENWRMALLLATKEKENERIIKLCSNLGAIYLDQGYLVRNQADFHKADSFLNLAHKTLITIDSVATNSGLKTLRLIATSFHFQKKYDSAAYYYKKVIGLSKGKFAIPFLGATSFYAEMLSELGKHDEAIAFIKEATTSTEVQGMDSKSKTHITHVYGEVLHKSGNDKEAYRLMDSSYRLLATDYEKINAQAYAESESKFKNQLLQYQVALERQKKNRLYYFFGGLILLAALVILWLYNRHSKRMAAEKALQKQISIDAFIEGEEKEKMRIGRELHDGIAQEIVAVKLAMQKQPGENKLVDDLTRISMDLRNISHELMPQTLKEYGLQLAIEDSCLKLLKPSGIRYEVDATLGEERLSNKIEITLYRIFQELLHNIVKHSQATEVLVQLKKMHTHILLVVEDNGRGISSEKKSGIGLSNVRSRVQLVDGNLQYDSSETEGTTAIVRVPL